jgi:hypothetical protein
MFDGGGFGEPMVRVETSDLLIRYSSLSNSGADAVVVSSGSPTITQSNIFNNDGYGVRNTGAGTVHAVCNYWGDPSGPDAPANPGGSGQTVSGNANVLPFRTAFFLLEDDNCTPIPTAVELRPATSTAPAQTMPFVAGGTLLLLTIGLLLLNQAADARTISRDGAAVWGRRAAR